MIALTALLKCASGQEYVLSGYGFENNNIDVLVFNPITIKLDVAPTILHESRL